MKKIIVLVFLPVMIFMGNINEVSAQGYTNGIGLRGGFEGGVTFKHFLDDAKAVEIIAYNRWKGWGLIGLLEWHATAFGVDGLQWFYGIGAHVGAHDWESYGHHHKHENDNEFHTHNGTALAIGIDPIVGIEYHIGDIPISIGIDVKPSISFIGYNNDLSGGGLTIRYTW